jgi:hypothetical protein
MIYLLFRYHVSNREVDDASLSITTCWFGFSFSFSFSWLDRDIEYTVDMDRVKPTFEKKEWQGDKQAIDNLVVS